MDDANSKAILELLERPGNDSCADCGQKRPKWASYNIGVFLCTSCAQIHKGMGAHISKVKHIRLDKWEDSQIQRLKEIGNNAAKLKYEERVPPCYRVPVNGDPQALLEEWICGKYMREEFSRSERYSFMTGNMEGFLMKRGKEDSRYQPRRFVLSESEDYLKYYVKENKEAKATIRLSDLNIYFSPEKLEKKNSFQISFVKEGVVRHIYLYHDDPQTIVTWYNTIRCAKLHRLQIAFPTAHQNELVNRLPRDFIQEGWLWKTGPRPTDSYKKRWFSLDRRTLMYHEEPLAAHPKGEIFIGNMMDGYSVRVGVPPGAKDHDGYSFTLRTPERWYLLSAESSFDRDLWIQNINSVIDSPTVPQDFATHLRITKKKSGSGLNIFSSR